jgi:hypothetical protein
VSAPEPIDTPPAPPGRPRSMAFRRRRNAPLPTPEESRRQNEVVRSAWLHFGEPGPVIAFLNTRHEGLDGHPLHLAIESDEGLQRVQTLLERMTLER